MRAQVVAWKQHVLLACTVLRIHGRLPRDVVTYVIRNHFVFWEAGCWLCLRRFQVHIPSYEGMVHDHNDTRPICGKDCDGIAYIVSMEWSRSARRRGRGFAARFEEDCLPPVTPELSKEERAARIRRTLDDMYWSVKFLRKLNQGLLVKFEAGVAIPHQQIAHDIQLALIQQEEEAEEAVWQAHRRNKSARGRVIAELRDAGREHRHVRGRRRGK